MSFVGYLLYTLGQVSPDEALRGPCSHPAGYDTGKRRPCLPLLYHHKYIYIEFYVKPFFDIARQLGGDFDAGNASIHLWCRRLDFLL
jgi:hypothetical protein